MAKQTPNSGLKKVEMYFLLMWMEAWVEPPWSSSSFKHLLSDCSAICNIYNHLVLYDFCFSSSHHIWILTSRKKKRGAGTLTPLRYFTELQIHSKLQLVLDSFCLFLRHMHSPAFSTRFCALRGLPGWMTSVGSLGFWLLLRAANTREVRR